jgi:hypothetical protein
MAVGDYSTSAALYYWMITPQYRWTIRVIGKYKAVERHGT